MSWTPCKNVTVQKNRCLVITLAVIVLQLYIVHRVYRNKYDQIVPSSVTEQSCRLHKDCRSNCSVCLDRKCQDIRSGDPCEAPDFVENIQMYFKETKWDDIEVLSVRCLGHITGVEFKFQAPEEVVTEGRKYRQHDSQNFVDHMLICDRSLWIYSSLLPVIKKNDGNAERKILALVSTDSASLPSQGSNNLKNNEVDQNVQEIHKDIPKPSGDLTPHSANQINPNVQQSRKDNVQKPRKEYVQKSRKDNVQQLPKDRTTSSLAQLLNKNEININADVKEILNNLGLPVTTSSPALQPSNNHRNAQTIYQDKVQSSTPTLPPYDVNNGNMNRKVQKVFEDISQRSSWGGGNETRSGTGSMMLATVALRQCLGRWIVKYNISSIVDIPCGDANWQRKIPGIERVSYMGFDISPNSVKIAQTRNPKTMRFGILDLTSAIPPKADLIIMRDFIQHLPLQLGKKAIENARKSGATWLAISSYPNSKYNRNIRVGDYYLNNLQISPFNVQNVVEFCDNYSGKEKYSHPGSKVLLIRNKQIFV